MAEIVGGDKLLQKIRSLAAVLDYNEPLQEACLQVANEAKKKIKEKGLDKHGESGLMGSIAHQVVGNVGYVGSKLEYAPYVEFGTGIYAKNQDGRKTPWVFYTPQGYTYENPQTGEKTIEHWATTVGQKPQPFLYPALDENKEMINQIFKIFIERELGK